MTFWRLIALVGAALLVTIAATALSNRGRRRQRVERAVAAAAFIVGVYTLLVTVKAVL